eukprot:sb/3476836/
MGIFRTPIYRAPIYRNPDLPGGFFPPIFFGKFSKFGRLVNLHLQFARPNGDHRCLNWYRILDKIRIYGSNMLYPDIPGTPIYREKWLPPRIPVNRGPTVYSLFLQDRSLSRSC